MGLIVSTPPLTAPVYLADAKRQCRVHASDTTHDALIQDYLDAAIAHLDGPDGILQLALEPQTWIYTLDAFDGNVALPIGPVITVDSVKYFNADDDLTTIDAADYALRQLSDYRSEIVPIAAWPSAISGSDKVQIEFTAGFEGDLDSESHVPAIPGGVRQAILLHVRNMFEPYDDQAAYQRAVDDFLRPFKRLVLA